MSQKPKDRQKPQARQTPSQPTELPYEQFHKDRLLQCLVAMVVITAIFYAAFM